MRRGFRNSGIESAANRLRKRGWRSCLAGLLVVVMLAGGAGQPVYGDRPVWKSGEAESIEGLLEQLAAEAEEGGVLEQAVAGGVSVEDAVYGEAAEPLELADAGEGFPVKISAAPGGAPGTGDSKSSSVSGDGRYVAYASASGNLVDGDTNGKQDIFLYDRVAGTTKRINLGTGGVQANGDSYAPAVSLDGAYTLFTSKATNLINGDTNLNEDLFLYDNRSGALQRIAETVPGSEFAGAGSSYQISADGRYVAYAGKSKGSGDCDIWLLDRRLNTVKLIARQKYIYETFRSRVSISADGRFLAFDSLSPDIVPDDAGTRIGDKFRDVYLYDTATDEMKKISRSPSGATGNKNSYYPIISADGSYVAYLSRATNIVPEDTKAAQDLYVYNRLTGATELGSLDSGGNQPGVDVYDPSISADGRYIVFHTDGAFDASDSGRTDVYARDRAAGKTYWISQAASGGNADDHSDRAAISADASTVLFESKATNLGAAPDADASKDIYAAPLEPLATGPVWPEEAQVTVSPGASYVALTWPAVSGAIYYKVLQDDRLIGITASASFAAEGLAPGSEHRFRVAAGSSGYLWSEWSAELAVTTLTAPETTPPGGAAAQVVPVLGGAQVSWSYSGDPDIVGAKVRWRKTGGAGADGTIHETVLYPRSVTSVTVPNLANGQFYDFSIAIIDGDGNSSAGEWSRVKLPQGPEIVRMDVRAADGKPAASDNAMVEDISPDGRWTLFMTTAEGLDVNDGGKFPGSNTTPTIDLYLYDGALGTVQLISRGAAGKSGNGNSLSGSISDDGRLIVFQSSASDLLDTPDTNGKFDVFLYDRDIDEDGIFDETLGTELMKLSTPQDGGHASGGSGPGVISGDGNRVIFNTDARNLVNDSPESGRYTIIANPHTRELKALMMPGGQHLDAFDMGISTDGKQIAFETFNSYSQEDNKSDDPDVYWYDQSDADHGKLVYVTGQIPNRYWSSLGGISGDGKLVSFSVTQRVPENPSQMRTMIYTYDSEAPPGTGPEQLLEQPLASLTGHNMSDDGRYVLFSTSEKNIVPGDTDSFSNLFVRDRALGTNMLVSLPYDPALPVRDYSASGRLAGNGAYVAFQSNMMDMVRGSERTVSGLYWQRIALAELPASWPSGSALTAAEIGSSSVRLSWTAAERANGYRITGGPSPIEVPAGTLETVAAGLAPDTDYAFEVQAVSSDGGWTADGPSAAVRTAPYSGLADLTITIDGTEARLAWGDPQPSSGTIAAFRVLRRSGSGDWTVLATTASANVRTFIDRTALPGKSYTYTIRSVDASGQEAPYSVEKTVSIGGFAIASFQYAMPLYFRQHAAQGDAVKLTLRGPAEAEAKATLDYEDIYGMPGSLTVELIEGAEAGHYTGALSVPEGAVKLVSLKARIEGAGKTAEAEALRGEIKVGGKVVIKLGGSLALPEDSTLTIYSKSANAYQTTQLAGRKEMTMKGLPAADDYKFTLLGAGGLDLFDDSPIAPVTVTAGGSHEVSAEPLLPAQLSVVVHKQTGSASDVRVIVTDTDGHPLAAGTTPLNGNLYFPAFKKMVGKKVMIRAVPADGEYAPYEQEVTLASGRNSQYVELALKTNATLEGTVVDREGKPVGQATVQVSYRGFYYKAKTDEEGRYTLSVPPGSVTAQALIGESFSSGALRIEMEGGQTRSVNFRFAERIPAEVTIKLYTEAGNGAWIGPYDLDWREMVHFNVSVSANRVTWGNVHPMLVEANPGEKVTVCVDGREGGYSKACAEAVIGEDRRGEVELRLPDPRSTATGKLVGAEAVLNLYRVDEGDRRSYVTSRSAGEGDLTLKLPGAGTYELRLVSRDGKSSLLRTFYVRERERIDLGQLDLTASGLFYGQAGNAVLLGSNSPGPGAAIQVRVNYANSGSAALSDAAVVLDVPADAELVSGSVVWNGAQVAPKQENGQYIVPLGALSGRGKGTLQYQLRIADEPVEAILDVAPRMRYRTGERSAEEEIGLARASISRIAISAPSRTAYRQFAVSGTAPPGSLVDVYAGDRVVGTAETAPTGRWSTSVRIEGEGRTAQWELSARAALAGKSWSSAPVAVRYDEGIAEPIAFTMKQIDGRMIQIDPREGEARFPYVFVPNLPFILTLTFNHPELVKNVAFHLGQTRVPASLKDGVYQAVISGVSHPGPIGIDYETRESAAGIEGFPPPAQELSAQLPPAFRGAVQENLVVSPREAGDRKQSMSYTGKLPAASGGGAQLTVNAALERTTYTPSANDLALEKETGVPLYGFQMKESFVDGVLKLELTGYLPADQFADGLDMGKALGLMSLGAESHPYAGLPDSFAARKAQVRTLSSAIGVVSARIGLAFKSVEGQNTWKTIDAAYSIYDGRGSVGTLAELEDMMDKVARYCRPEMVSPFMDHIQFLKNHLIAVELTKAGIMVASAVAGPATFGIGTIALFIAGNALGKVLDAQLGGMMDQLKADIGNNPYCKIPEKPKRKLADPEWIYDPSGYVFEVAEDNRIEGVRATALRWNTGTMRWEVWDADWYGQDNPLYTDAAGRYAWDVPEGKWKVLYEKEGYLPAESKELTVLPPHFDVNIPMISTLPAKPLRIEAAPGGAAVDILFDRHVKGATVSEKLFAVIDSQRDADVAGQWELVAPVNAGGGEASQHIRFTPDAPLAIGQTYRVFVDRAVQSYAGIPMTENYEGEIVVSEKDASPPAAVTELTAEADNDEALIAWKLPQSADVARLEVVYKAQDAAGEGSAVEVPLHQRHALLQGLSAHTAYQFEVRAYDAAGNYSVAKTTADTAGTQPLTGDIAPPAAVAAMTAAPDSTRVELAWQDPPDSDLSATRLQWARMDGTSANDPVTVATGAGRYTITDLTPSTEYEIRIWAVDHAGNASIAQALIVRTKAAGGGNPVPGSSGGGGNGGQSASSTESADLGEAGGEYSFFGGKLKLWLAGSGTTAGMARKATMSEETLHKPTDSRLRPVSGAYRWKLDADGSLLLPGKLTMAYEPELLKGADKRKLGLYRQHSSDAGHWIYVGGIVDGQNGTVIAEVQEPGVYAVLLAEHTFSDLKTHWSRNEVEILASRGIVSGNPDGTFRPNAKVTRAEFVKLLLPLIADTAEEPAPAPIFADVPQNAWYAEAVAQAAAAGIVQGAGGKFRPDDHLAREEMAVILFRVMGIDADIKLNAERLLASYADGGKVSGWARVSMAYAVSSGLFKGSSGKLNPGASATRAESAAVVLRTLEAMGTVVAEQE
ncbi:hypothetical protein PAECIP111893_00020 [Paenibacillus plantiphilus]|uniref:WD40 repeat protein n=1 Tax=Paenibacillus plantiphilus TaxID=2905650 RepID=A0ABM9BMG3_9BACL|nr:fibronectin type III domain-containing protein [Paenibacillus plantiphilus]CAH1189922.1 hypothetical protein PAECIP111893_00020 [Paenibacillus plantiphilus]